MQNDTYDNKQQATKQHQIAWCPADKIGNHQKDGANGY